MVLFEQSNDESERKSVTRLLAKMFSEPHSELANQNKPLWKCFLGRYHLYLSHSFISDRVCPKEMQCL